MKAGSSIAGFFCWGRIVTCVCFFVHPVHQVHPVHEFRVNQPLFIHTQSPSPIPSCSRALPLRTAISIMPLLPA